MDLYRPTIWRCRSLFRATLKQLIPRVSLTARHKTPPPPGSHPPPPKKKKINPGMTLKRGGYFPGTSHQVKVMNSLSFTRLLPTINQIVGLLAMRGNEIQPTMPTNDDGSYTCFRLVQARTGALLFRLDSRVRARSDC